MASLKEMRDQIKSVESTQKITRAMQMVAAAKLRRATDAAQNARPYAERIATVIANLAAGVSGDGAPKLLVGTGRQDRHLVVVASSDRGLAGGFNSSIIRAARERINALLAEGKDVKIITVGKKARDQFRRVFGDRFVATFEAGVPGLASAQPVADKITELFETGQVDVVTLAFSRYKSVVVQTPTLTQLIPAQIAGAAATIDLKGAAYEYEPDEETILETLLPRNLTVQLLSAMLENQAGFYAAQMAAMDNATRNAGDMIAALNLKKNRTRQAQITKELIEIISGAEAL
ncbi:MAG: F0F1 ATP synthase subunit gamma [Phenylobacterium sp.]|jgi:F-type H+-transporting ATPase subunit gamma|uniref:ATP synthase gamma chain n=1 Tax=Phenylobacterium ferrooxidans TaxID=2982689 RepID=A0ABW6CR04_9CAUL|nr:F0F1 ATP synthase subunit gamma [Phenylobacterium sp.]MDO8911141.1 F0F1 ATP synthase subunit gamma [Phenylobacterium sp.]MDO9245606.1 F0F1 ATP synthase subunit gamma [Phenylobacterium sp.]MDP2011687.1 F0F1 ATP synthase subunit gamma [Phenylobacterium sp.]MDP3102832.1 F0F1 ATP synthase subunit gamma [Phenylobacterium sp.]MDP3635518.1 F0F1 ATP synthase subunit gamma [Phenylobacterium sp.]